MHSNGAAQIKMQAKKCSNLLLQAVQNMHRSGINNRRPEEVSIGNLLVSDQLIKSHRIANKRKSRGTFNLSNLIAFFVDTDFY